MNNNPIFWNDRNGDAPGDTDPDETKKKIVNQFGLLIKNIYEAYHANSVVHYTIQATMNYVVIPPLKLAAVAVTETNGNKATWSDLTMMYMFEFGGKYDRTKQMPIIKITDINSPTISQLRTHTGVTEAKTEAEAMAKTLKPGEKKTISHSWTYSFKDMKRNLTTDWQDLEVFLGSYTTTVTVEKTRGVH